MLNQETLNKLHELRLSEMAEDIRHQLAEPSFEGLSFEERIGYLVDLEWTRRKNKKLKSLITKAKFCNPNASLEAIEYLPERKIDRFLITKLATGIYLEESRNIIITGATGSGKSFLACALGICACRQDKKVLYMRLPDLMSELADARIQGEAKKVFKLYKEVDLLILDEWLFMEVSPTEARDLLEITEARYDKKSTIFCSQSLPGGWHKKLGEDTLAEAILDRIVHNSYKIILEAKTSMRQRRALTI